MDLEMLLFAFAMCWKMSSAIRCYSCIPAIERADSTAKLCQYFDGSDAFITDCPHSTVCYTKETLLVDLGEPGKSLTRGCAHQLMDGYQEKIDGHWRHVNKIHEPYTEGCQENSNEFGSPTKTTHCFCRGNLCNSGVRTFGSALLLTVLFFFVL